MKAYSYNGERFSYYGYDASGERTYKMDMHLIINYVNNEIMTKTYLLNKLTLYPNGYININQFGEYTKHYYADALRMASKMASKMVMYQIRT